MTPSDIYNQIHTAIVSFWSMFVGVPVDSFTTLLYDLLIYGTQFFLGFLFIYVPWRILKIIWGG